MSAIIALAPEGIPRLDEVAIDCASRAVQHDGDGVATLLCGIAPIRHASVVNLIESLNDGSRTVAGGRSYRTRSSLLVAQIGLAVVLLVAAGLVVRSFNALQTLDLGFDREAVLRIKVRAAQLGRGRSTNGSASCCRRSTTMPGVESAGGVYLTPMELGSIGQGTWVVAEGQPETPETANSNPIVNYHDRDAGLLHRDGHPAKAGAAVHGRRSRDRAARGDHQREHRGRVFPRAESDRQAPQGRLVQRQPADPIGVWRTIVGVVGNVRYNGLTKCSSTCTTRRRSRSAPTTSLVVKLKRGEERNALAVASAIQTQARQLDPQRAGQRHHTLDEWWTRRSRRGGSARGCSRCLRRWPSRCRCSGSSAW